MIDLLLSHGTVITMDPKRSILEDGAVAIYQGKIVEIGQTEELERKHQARKIVDCKHRIIIPGLIDVHGHGGHSLIKTIAANTPDVWMKIVTPTYFHYTTDDFWYVDGLLSALERLKFGVTCGMSVMASMPRSDDPVFGSNHAKAYSEVGIREIVAVGPCAPPWPHKASRWKNGQKIDYEFSFEEALAGAEGVIEAWNHQADDRIRVFITPFTIVPSVPSWGRTPADLATTLQPEDKIQSRKIRDIAQKYQTRIHSDAFGGMVKLASKDDYALLGPDVILQHCLGLSMEEVKILAKTDTRVGHSPEPSQERCPVPELMESGVTVAISTDGNSPRVSFDLFQAVRKSQMLEHVHFGDSFYLPPGKLLEMVTIDAAKAIGWEDQIGSLEPGKKADIAIVNWRQPHLVPNFMPVHRLVYEAVGQDVETVVVDGKILMENRKVLSVNEFEILDTAQAESLATIKRAGLQDHLNPPAWGQIHESFDHPIRFPE